MGGLGVYETPVSNRFGHILYVPAIGTITVGGPSCVLNRLLYLNFLPKLTTYINYYWEDQNWRRFKI